MQTLPKAESMGNSPKTDAKITRASDLEVAQAFRQLKGLYAHVIIGQPNSQRFYLPNKGSNVPDDRNQGISLSHIRRVRQFTHHNFHDSSVAAQYTAHKTAGEAMSVLQTSLSARDIPDDKAPEVR